MKFKLGDVCIAISPFPLNDGLKVVIVGVNPTYVLPGHTDVHPYLIRRVGGAPFPRISMGGGRQAWYRITAAWARERHLLPCDGLTDAEAKALAKMPVHPHDWLVALSS
ncbi:hypothetical protein [Hydrogenophaga sp.]|uniref:hypothetical protein n=1 Tax=Hydrogenophaga sp. TaxID=1904254 RepID=UPI002728DDFA|nr:hypothetical protein [Hydrogenophaga sp.]MDO9507240.1 hypothetical protein [Hydrogenophaga sp.]